MGVKYLWDIIDDARSVETLDSLRGKTICVDLSIWIVEAKQTLQFKTSILKPHLRNLFFRVLYLRRLGVKLIFVTEGDPPDLKQETMRRRAVAQYGVKTKIKGKIGRGRFQHTINECTKMLDLIGVPHVRGHGEAEAMCAVLNKHKMADGCLTNDGDFFLYGGETIYRDFGINPKDQHVLIYTTEGIKKRTNLTRHDMIGLALLNGCDYTQGVAGVGKRTIKKFLEEREFDEDLLIRIQKWSDEDFKHLEECSDAELTIIKKLHKEKANKFPDDKIIDEFLVQKDKLDGVRQKMKWSYPHIKDLQEYLLKHLEWPEDYTLPKILQLATSTYLEKLSDGTFFPVPITPTSILKTRCQMGVALVDVGWDKHDDENTTYGQKWTNCPDTMVTLENQQVVTKTLPKLIEEYDQKKSAKTTKKKASSKKGTSTKTGISASQTSTQPVFDSVSHDLYFVQSEEPAESLDQFSSQSQASLLTAEPTVQSDYSLTTRDLPLIQSDISMKTRDPELTNPDTDEDSSDEDLLPSLAQRLVKLKLKNEQKKVKSAPVDDHFNILVGAEKKPVTEDIVNSIETHCMLKDRSAKEIASSLPQTNDSTVWQHSEIFGEIRNVRHQETGRLEENLTTDFSDTNRESLEKSENRVDSKVVDDEISKVTSQGGTPDKNSQPGDNLNEEYDFSFGVQFFDSPCDPYTNGESARYDSNEPISSSDSKQQTFNHGRESLPVNSCCSNSKVQKEHVKSERTKHNFEDSINYNGEHFSSTPFVRRQKSELLDNGMLNQSETDSLLEAFEFQTYKDSLLEALENDGVGKEQPGRGCENINTPPCLDLSTPDIVTSSLPGQPKSCLKEITNFSHLGDSILVEDVLSTPLLSNKEIQRCQGNKENDVMDYEKALRRKLNLSEMTDFKNDCPDVCENKPSFLNSQQETVLYEDTEDIEIQPESTSSPLSLADRLKFKLRK
ncbi:flap endonuclease GEN-like isoform X1 [Clytia hemisphaerica]|uniref:Uncharacterized protein n=1 Tax=Clytia hemisphaerica TaxID=252671 RepID=A0A7M5U676_9CNID